MKKLTRLISLFVLTMIVATTFATTVFANTFDELTITLNSVIDADNSKTFNFTADNTSESIFSFGWVGTCQAIATTDQGTYSTVINNLSLQLGAGTQKFYVTISDCPGEIQSIKITDILRLVNGLPENAGTNGKTYEFDATAFASTADDLITESLPPVVDSFIPDAVPEQPSPPVSDYDMSLATMQNQILRFDVLGFLANLFFLFISFNGIFFAWLLRDAYMRGINKGWAFLAFIGSFIAVIIYFVVVKKHPKKYYATFQAPVIVASTLIIILTSIATPTFYLKLLRTFGFSNSVFISSGMFTMVMFVIVANIICMAIVNRHPVPPTNSPNTPPYNTNTNANNVNVTQTADNTVINSTITPPAPTADNTVINSTIAPPAPTYSQQPPQRSRFCVICGQVLTPEWCVCPNCGKQINKES